MKLLTEEIKATLPALYSQENVSDPIVRVKYFTPWGNWTWYALEGQPEATDEDENDFLFFGWVDGPHPELGYFCLSQLQSVRGPAGLRVERDLYFDPMPLSEVKKRH